MREVPGVRRVHDLHVWTLALMVGYTVVGLWIIAQPIVETGPTG